MNNSIDWFCSFIRVVGVNFPGAASLVQIQAEIDSQLIEKRLLALEDPISVLHADVHAFSKDIFVAITDENTNVIEFSDDLYKKYSRVIAVLESEGLIHTERAAGCQYPLAIILDEPLYVMYVFALYEDPKNMEELFNAVDGCEVGEWLDGEKMNLGISIVAIRAMFLMFSEKEYGLVSNEIGACRYQGNA